MGLGSSKGSYAGKMIQSFQGLYQGNIVLTEGWFLLRCILILYLQEKGHGVEIKTAIAWDDFNISTMMFFNNRDYPNLDNRTDIQWGWVLQQHQITADDCSVGLIVSVGHINIYKVSWYTI